MSRRDRWAMSACYAITIAFATIWWWGPKLGELLK